MENINSELKFNTYVINKINFLINKEFKFSEKVKIDFNINPSFFIRLMK